MAECEPSSSVSSQHACTSKILTQYLPVGEWILAHHLPTPLHGVQIIEAILSLTVARIGQVVDSPSFRSQNCTGEGRQQTPETLPTITVLPETVSEHFSIPATHPFAVKWLANIVDRRARGREVGSNGPREHTKECSTRSGATTRIHIESQEDAHEQFLICELAHPIWSCIPRLFILLFKVRLATSDIIRLELAAVIVSLDTTLGTVASTEFVKGSDHLGAIEVAVGARDKEATVAGADAAGAFVAADEVAVARLNLAASSITVALCEVPAQCRASARVGVLSMTAPQQHDDHDIHK
ncbi:hypothetical protein SELMODRAFT_429427 [Selaginella moellendorffii]|uniref:Uncharacterized protein n=1 Tax=Selaginella moellendorffii TaxID=88036 RepID=D8T649_SELML|nr:hypothetical protein SELMODRAFT_429427 [Selaginella moellendorffii]